MDKGQKKVKRCSVKGEEREKERKKAAKCFKVTYLLCKNNVPESRERHKILWLQR